MQENSPDLCGACRYAVHIQSEVATNSYSHVLAWWFRPSTPDPEAFSSLKFMMALQAGKGYMKTQSLCSA